MKHQDALDQLARETARAKGRIALERALRVALPVLLGVGAWAAIALSGLHGLAPPIVQSIAAIAVLGLMAVFAARAWASYRGPEDAEARARLAADSALDVAAFEALGDRPSRYDAFSMALWAREREHAIAKAERAKAGPTRPELDELDPYKLRFVLILAVVAAAAFAGAAAPDRLARAFLPDPGPLLGDQPLSVEAWVTPADYTGAPPISLSDRLGERVETPPTVEATVRVTGPVGAPVLVFEGRDGTRRTRFTQAADGAWEAHLALPGAGRLKIARFHTQAQWRIAPAPDAIPRAAFTAPLSQLTDEYVGVQWRAEDDFGVERLALRVVPLDPPASLAQAPPIDTPLQPPAGAPRRAEGEIEVDLADHPYAGMEVEARLVAVDALGQEGVSSPLRFALPEKVFLQPLARAAIEIRRHILTERRAYRRAGRQSVRTMPAGGIVLGSERIEVRDANRRPALRRAPDGIQHAARLTDALTMEPRDGYFRDLAVFLGFRYARSELELSQSIEDTNLPADILWRTALRAEYGGAADARRALEEAQRQLAEALASGAPPERIRQLVEALRRATENYMQALVQEALRQGERQTAEDTEDQASISESDIEELLREVQRLSEQGRTAEAQQLLQMLSNILNNLDVQLAESQSGEGQQGEGQQQMQESMDELSDTIGEQRRLNDETRRQNDEGGSEGEQQGGQGGAEDLADRQAQIREALGRAQENSSEAGAAPSDSLENAERAMRQAENALNRSDLDAAESAQEAALESLREGAEQLAAEMRNRGQQSERQGQASGPRDPLGRLQPGGGMGESDTQIPTEIDPVRAREILDEIRRRAQDPQRPESERDYLRRLLDRFGDS